MSRRVPGPDGKSDQALFRASGPGHRSRRGFSLVEIVLSLGVVVFAMFGIIGMLGLGLEHNHISIEETKAADILSILKSDCLNSRSLSPSAVGLLGLPLPYNLSTAGAAQGSSAGISTTNADYQLFSTSFNPSLTDTTLYTTGISENETPVTAAAGVPYQASIVYTFIPVAPSQNPIQARLIVNWPCHPTTLVSDLVNPSIVRGYVETYITLPAP